jgi:hypothetical protein
MYSHATSDIAIATMRMTKVKTETRKGSARPATLKKY